MKKLLIVCVVSLLASHFALLTGHAAANDTLITFSTPGPDKYSDGATVLDGECYALVWTKAGATFAGLAADGKVVDSENNAVLVYAPVAKSGRCPTVVFELDADLAAMYAGGSYGVCLLDTRLASGRVGGLNSSGVPVAVNGYGEVKGEGEGSPSNGSGSFADLSLTSDLESPSIAVTTKSAIPANAPKPQITSIRIVGANVVLTVKNTLPCLMYAAEEVAELGQKSEVNAQLAEGSAVQPSTSSIQSAATQGAATTNEEITVIIPKKGDSGFFKVGRE